MPVSLETCRIPVPLSFPFLPGWQRIAHLCCDLYILEVILHKIVAARQGEGSLSLIVSL
jgi:hypothetical protein